MPNKPPREGATSLKENLVTHRSYALALLVSLPSLWFAPQALAQDEAAPPPSSIENEMPPGDPPKVKKEEVLEAPQAEGSIKDV